MAESIGDMLSVRCMEAVGISECPLRDVPLYLQDVYMYMYVHVHVCTYVIVASTCTCTCLNACVDVHIAL